MFMKSGIWFIWIIVLCPGPTIVIDKGDAYYLRVFVLDEKQKLIHHLIN